MKKFLYVNLIVILMFSLSGCSQAVEKDQVSNYMEEEDTLSIMDYYPFAEDMVMEYEGIGNEYAEQTRVVEFIEENKMQIKVTNPGTVFVNVLEYNNGELKEVFDEGEFYHIENMINANRNLDNIILKEPLVIGNSWTNKAGETVEITSLDKEINTPNGKYKALEVSTKHEDGAIEKNYYVKNIGFIANIYKDKDFEVSSLLKSIDNQGQKINVEAYYPSKDDMHTKYVNKEVVFNTNDHIVDILEDVLKNPNSNKVLGSISNDTKINEIYLDRSLWTLRVDFSEELLEDINAGSSYEFEILKSIVNTLGRFYDVDKVYITVNGNPYESGHIDLKEGEYFEVDIDSAGLE